MATYTWTGTTSTSWATAANWQPAGGPPTTGDTVIIPRQAFNPLLSALDRTGDAAGAGLNLALFRVDRGSTVQIGSLGNPLRITCSDLTFKGAAPFFYDSEMGSGGNATTRTLIQAANADVMVHLTGTNSMTNLFVLRGNVTYTNTAANQFLFVGYTTDQVRDATFTVASTSASIANSIIFGGKINTIAALPTVWFAAGDWTQADGAVTLLYQGAGRCNYNSTDGLGLLYAFLGTMDFTQTSEPKTLTTAYVWPNSDFRYIEDLLTGTINFVDKLL